MLIRILHPATRRELYSMSTAIPTCTRKTPTTWGLYGPDGAFKRMMTTIRADARLREAGGYIMCTQHVQTTPLGPVVRKTHAEYSL